mmetsp:Transcript_126559/g.393960  ORF Transcript_126559/g.393960 Transcript_126559/m.393960 type:complete len:222 (-) Transcript_126559:16-681(-)
MPMATSDPKKECIATMPLTLPLWSDLGESWLKLGESWPSVSLVDCRSAGKPHCAEKATLRPSCAKSNDMRKRTGRTTVLASHIPAKPRSASAEPAAMKGRRRPHREACLSESLPAMGQISCVTPQTPMYTPSQRLDLSPFSRCASSGSRKRPMPVLMAEYTSWYAVMQAHRRRSISLPASSRGSAGLASTSKLHMPSSWHGEPLPAPCPSFCMGSMHPNVR